MVGGEWAVDIEVGDECDDCDEMDLVSSSRGRGAIGTAGSPTLLYAGYPSHCLPDLTHLVHCGRVSSHLTLRILKVEVSSPPVESLSPAEWFAYLQLLHPVFTLGRLALLALTVFSSAPVILFRSSNL